MGYAEDTHRRGGEDHCTACLYFNKIGFDQKNNTFVCSEAVEFKLLKL